MSKKRFCFKCGKERPSNWFAEGWTSIQEYAPKRFSGVACKEHSEELLEQLP
jgi:hypothetical protein